MTQPNNPLETVSLIGMPGAGKSTVGVMLAKLLGLGFTDSDLVIQVRHGKSLQAILNESGYLHLRQLEEEVLLDIDLAQQLISTGGSAVYSSRGMLRLKSAGPVVFLDVPLAELRQRVDNAHQRGIAHPPGQDFADVFAERQPLYLQYADLVVDAAAQSAEATARLIAGLL
jgi:shikimate kinase